eukprot:scaffold2624_cov282-Prasinococcus_capsulatus_cf.AAC.3
MLPSPPPPSRTMGPSSWPSSRDRKIAQLVRAGLLPHSHPPGSSGGGAAQQQHDQLAADVRAAVALRSRRAAVERGVARGIAFAERSGGKCVGRPSSARSARRRVRLCPALAPGPAGR